MIKILFIIICLFPANSYAAWPWSSPKPLVSINGSEYFEDDFDTWWVRWRDDEKQKPKHVEEYVNYLLLLKEAQSMELYSVPEINRKYEVFLKVQSLMLLKRDEVDSKIAVTEDQIKGRYEINYAPRKLVAVLNFRSVEEAQKAHAKFVVDKPTFEQLKILSSKGSELSFAIQHPQWIVPKSIPPSWGSNLDKASVGFISPPISNGELTDILYVLDVVNSNKEDLKKVQEDIKEDLRKIQYQQYTVSLIDKLRTKFNVIIDYQLFDRINIISPRPEDNDKILIRSDKSVVPVSYFIEQCKKENSLGRSDLNNKDQQDQLKKRVINIMVSNSIVMWEALDRHYEEFSPLKEDYKFTKEYNVVKELERRLYKEIHVSQEEIARYYNDNKSSFTKPVELRLVLVEGSKKDIKSLWTQVISGSQIIKSASQLNLPVKITSQQATNYDQLSTEVAKVVKALKPGELSRPIAGKNLYSLIKLEKRHAETIKKIDQVRTLISKTIIKNKQVEIKKQFIQKLAQNSDIITNTDLWDMVIKKYTD